MKKLLLSVIAAVLTVFGMVGIAAISPAAYADGSYYCIGENGQGSWVNSIAECTTMGSSQINKNNLMSTINTVINVIIGVVGFIAVAVIILGGISFITSQGDAAKVTKARNTILYGVVGLIVAILAFAIVNFVLGSVFNAGGSTGVWIH